ncbi:peptidoglycan-binding domain-containing protein [Thalassococcus sp. BH17M4-6]|uniref:peptidoglycan-binding domain-containing protein n=1 Tax=Thalassococcus sp. BH17M4-6 TaxID=3413148 RepID=UPI003BC6A2C5
MIPLPLSLILSAALALILTTLPGAPAAAGPDFSPVQTLTVENRTALDITPDKVYLQGDDAYVLGTNAAGASVIELRDGQTLQALTSVTLKMAADDLAIDPRGRAVYAIVNDGKSSYVAVFDRKLERIGGLNLRRLLQYAVLSATPDDFLTIGALRTDSSDGFFGVVDVNDPTDPQFRQSYRASDAWRGVTGAWFDAQNLTLFANAAWDSRLQAISVGKERILSEVSEESASKTARQPYATFPLLGNLPCRSGRGTSFLVADMGLQVLSLVDYNDLFQSLDPQSTVSFSLAPTRAISPVLPGTNMREPAGLVSASCDQSVILVGSRLSFEIDQFARNDGLSILELVGTVTLPFLPSDLDVSEDGSYALATSARDNSLLRLAATDGGSGSVRIIGDPDVRELQRLLTEIGLPVGSIDGLVGANTLRATALAEKQLGIQLDPQNDLQGSIDLLRRATE